MMPRILVTSDLQWSDQDRDEYRHAFVDRFIKLARKSEPDRIYILGDLTEEKDAHSARLVNRVVDHLYRMSEIAPVTVLRGNHDYRDIGYPFFEFVARFERITWINTPTAFGGALFLPHTRDHKRDWSDIDLKSYKLVFAHNIFEGARAGSGHVLSGIPVSLFADDARVFSGDVHEPQAIGPVIYVGSPYLCDAGDTYKPRVILLDGRHMTSIGMEGPQKRLIDLEIKDGAFKVHQEFNKGDIAKVCVHLLPDQTAQWATIKEKVIGWANKLSLQHVTIVPVFHTKPKTGARPTYVRRTDEEYLASYGQRVDTDPATLKLGRKLLEA